MKKLQWYPYTLVALFTLFFISCDTEPIGDPLPEMEQEIVLEPGDFIARVGNINFSAGATAANINEDGLLTISGANQNSGEIITLSVEDAAEGTFSLTANASTQNAAIFIFQQEAANPYTSLGSIGGQGLMTIIELDTVEQTISGTFSFNGVRPRLDANGVPIVDSNGNPVYETIFVSEGQYFKIPYTTSGGTDGGTDDTDDGGDTDGEENTDNVFEANTDGTAFNATAIFTELVQVGELPIVRVTAMNANGETIYLNIPENLGIGSFAMGDDDDDGIFDLTQLFGSYSDGNGGNSLTSSSGVMTITDFSVQTGRIFGGFQFLATDPIGDTPSVNISNGNFRLFYTPNPANSDPLACVIDEVAFMPNEFVTFTNTFEDTEQEVVTYRTSNGIQQIRLVFPKDITTGTYAMATAQVDGTEVVGYYIPDITVDSPIEYSSNPGTFTVTSYNDFTGAIEGTFAFTATDPTGGDPINTFEIEEGTFTFIVED